MKLNDEQLAVVNSQHNRILVLAGAGTGKTSCMLSRVRKVVEDGAIAKSVLVLTFTNAAAFEMKSRYINEYGTPSPEFRTFHSFCYSLLKRDKEFLQKLGYSAVPSIASEEDTKRIRHLASMQVGIHLTKETWAGKNTLNPKIQRQYDIVKKAESRIMKNDNLITFDSLCYDVCKLFESDDPIVDRYRNQYKYIFVDEFQDTDPKQWKFVKSFKDANICVVGDALQAIYSFRGADSSIIKSLAENPDWEVHKLYRNYRSTRDICKFANDNTHHAKDSYRIEIESDKVGGEFKLIDYTRVDLNTYVDADCLQFCTDVLPTLSGVSAILCRTNSEVNLISKHLLQHDVAHHTNRNFYSTEHIIKSILDDDYAINWIVSSLTLPEYIQYVRECAIQGIDNMSFDDIVSKYGATYSVADKIIDIMSCRSTLSRAKDLLVAFKKICKLLHLPSKDFNSLELKDTNELVNSLLELLSSLDSTDLYVGTIHSAKGLEYDNVAIIGVGTRSFQLTHEENQNLYYVGITRAKTNLYVFRGK